MGNLSIRCRSGKTPGAAVRACPRRSSASMSFSWLFLGGVVSTRAPPPLHQPGPVCDRLGSRVEDFSANGKVSLNWLSHPRGQVHFDSDESEAERKRVSVFRGAKRLNRLMLRLSFASIARALIHCTT